MGEFNSEGIPTGWSGDSPFRDAKDTGIFGDLMSNIEPKTGLSLLQDSNLLNGEIGSGLFGKIPPGFGGLGGLGGLGGQNLGIPAIPKVPNPFGNLPGGSLGHPSLPGVPSIPTVASSLPGVPSNPPTADHTTLPSTIPTLTEAQAF